MTSSAADNEAGRPEMAPRDLRDLAMLADGSLPPARRAEVESRINAAANGSALLENERKAVEALRGAATVRAPAALRERIAADGARAGWAVPRRRAMLGGGLAGALAVVALVLLLVLPGGTPGAPSVSQAASLALRGASLPAPPLARSRGRATDRLARDVDEVYFPARLGAGSKATGERVDRLDGRVARTIFYTTPNRAQIAYTIVGGPALTEPSGGAASHLNNIELRTIALRGRLVVTWRHDGHTCVLSAAGVPDQKLLELAAWKAAV